MLKKVTIIHIFIFLFGIYIFIIPFQHTAAIRNISLYLSMILFIYLVIKKEIIINYKNILFILFSLFFIESIISILINQVDIHGSIKELRTNLFEQFYILIVILSVFNNKKMLENILKVLLLSYIFITIASLIEVTDIYLFKGGISVLLDRGNRGIYNFYSGYSRLSVLYFTLLYGYFIYSYKNFNNFFKIIYILILLLSFSLILLYFSSTIIISTIIVLFIPLIFLLNYKKIFLSLTIFLIIFFSFDKFYLNYKISNKIFNVNQYNFASTNFLSGRGGIWKGIYLTLDTPKHILFGYGYGWKKLSLIVGKSKYRNKFNNKDDIAFYNYFEAKHYGKVNPHSGYLEILFTNGFIGLLIFLSIIILSLYFILKSKANFSKFILLPLLVTYVFNNFMNGYWEGDFGKIIVIFFAFSYILYRIDRNEKNNIPSS